MDTTTRYYVVNQNDDLTINILGAGAYDTLADAQEYARAGFCMIVTGRNAHQAKARAVRIYQDAMRPRLLAR